VQFSRELRDAVLAGDITVSVRLWQRPQVKEGGRYRVGPGLIEIDAVELVPFSEITEADVRQAGEPDRETLRDRAAHAGPIDEDTLVYRIELHAVAPDADPFARQHGNWAQWFGSSWEAIRSATEARARAAIQQWGLADAEPFGSGGVGYVYRARLRSGEPVVLKVEPAAPGTPPAVDRALAVWSRAGLAPRVIASRDSGLTLLLEQVTPGTQLGDHERAFESSLAVIAGMARRLRAVPRTTADGSFPTIAEHAEADGWRRALEHDPEALAELDALLAMPADALIHNDLYQDNLLRAGDDWVVIDPKPVLADPHAECFAFLAAAEYVTDRAMLDRYAEIAGLSDPERLVRWVRIRALIITAERARSERPTADSAEWDAHLQALARML
jgi:hypothetical protein